MKKFLRIISNIVVVLFVIIAAVFALTLLPIKGNLKIMAVTSGSMEPTIHTGAVVVIKPEQSYKKEDIVTFKSTQKKDDFTTHRVFAVEEVDGSTVLQTKGDANKDPDFEKIGIDKVLGKVIFNIPVIGRAISFIKTLPGLIIIIIIPSLAIIYQEVDKIKVEVKGIKDKRHLTRGKKERKNAK